MYNIEEDIWSNKEFQTEIMNEIYSLKLEREEAIDKIFELEEKLYHAINIIKKNRTFKCKFCMYENAPYKDKKQQCKSCISLPLGRDIWIFDKSLLTKEKERNEYE